MRRLGAVITVLLLLLPVLAVIPGLVSGSLVLDTGTGGLLPAAPGRDAGDGAGDPDLELLRRRVMVATAGDPVSLRQYLEASEGFRLDPLDQAGPFSYRHRQALIPCAICRDPRARIDEAFLSPFGGITEQEIAGDPFMIMRSLVAARGRGVGYHPAGCLLLDPPPEGRGGGEHRSGGPGRGRLCAFSGTYDPLIRDPEEFSRRIRDYGAGDPTLIYTGEVFFAAEAAERSRCDMTRIGGVSALVALLLFLRTFRSGRALLLTFLSLGTAMATGVAAVLLIFGRIHVAALGLGACLIGICADYNLHMLLRLAGGARSPFRSFALSLLVSAASSCGAYLIMSLTELPALRQLAVMAAAALGATCLIVLFLFPLIRIPPASPGRLADLAAGRLSSGSGRAGTFLALGCLLAGILAWMICPPDDDVARMQAPNQDLLAMAAELGRGAGGSGSPVWFFLRAPDTETALIRCEELAGALSPEEVGRLILPCRWIPSRKSQGANQESYRRSAGALRQAYGAYGVEPDLSSLNEDMSFDPLDHPLSGPLLLSPKGLFIRAEATDGELLSFLEAWSDLERVDGRRRWSSAFAACRQALERFLAGGLILAALVSSLVLGRSVFRCFLLPVAGGLGAGLAASALAGGYLSVFTVLAGFMILGLGADYCVFWHSLGRGDPRGTAHALWVSWLTTEASFGMLSLSGTAAIASFGICLSWGLAAVLLLVLLSGRPGADPGAVAPDPGTPGKPAS